MALLRRRQFRAILAYNRGRKDRLADGIVVTPSHNPPADGGFKYNSPDGGPADTDITDWVQQRANALLRNANRGVKRLSYDSALKAPTTHQQDLVSSYVNDLAAVVDIDRIRANGSGSASIRLAAPRSVTGKKSASSINSI